MNRINLAVICVPTLHSLPDEKDAIGRRYRRQDAIGTPYCVTIDHQTLEDNTFTLRDRDSMEQKRINNKDLKNIIEKELTLNSLLNNLK